MTIYKFIGEGAGVPGLPHELSEDDAVRLGVLELLADGLANGSYVVVGETATKDTKNTKVKTKEVKNG